MVLLVCKGLENLKGEKTNIRHFLPRKVPFLALFPTLFGSTRDYPFEANIVITLLAGKEAVPHSKRRHINFECSYL